MPDFNPNSVLIQPGEKQWVDIVNVPSGVTITGIRVDGAEFIEGMVLWFMDQNHNFTVNGVAPGSGSITAAFSDGSSAKLVFTIGGGPPPVDDSTRLSILRSAQSMLDSASVALVTAENLLSAAQTNVEAQIARRNQTQEFYNCLLAYFARGGTNA